MDRWMDVYGMGVFCIDVFVFWMEGRKVEQSAAAAEGWDEKCCVCECELSLSVGALMMVHSTIRTNEYLMYLSSLFVSSDVHKTT